MFLWYSKKNNIFFFSRRAVTILTISAVAPFLTGLQFITNTFILTSAFMYHIFIWYHRITTSSTTFATSCDCFSINHRLDKRKSPINGLFTPFMKLCLLFKLAKSGLIHVILIWLSIPFCIDDQYLFHTLFFVSHIFSTNSVPLLYCHYCV